MKSKVTISKCTTYNQVLNEGAELINFETAGIKKIITQLPFLPYYYISDIVNNVDVIIKQ